MKKKDGKELFISAAAKCVGGDVRSNEDNIFFNGDYIQEDLLDEVFEIKTGRVSDVNVFAVFDGMGRSGTGHEASCLAASELSSLYQDMNDDDRIRADDIVLDYINDVNEAIGVRSKHSGHRSATAMAILIIENNTAHVYNLGDCRVYILRNGQFKQVSKDHLPRRGETVSKEFDNSVSQFLGIYDNEGTLSPYRSKPIRIQDGDRFVICSDGITDYVDNEDLAEITAKNSDPFEQCSAIINKAESNSGRDNMSVSVVHVSKKKFHLTTNMIQALIGAGILILGFIFGYIVGYMFGNSSYNKDVVEQSVLMNETASESVSSEDISSEEVISDDISSEDGESSEDDASSVLKATRVYFPAGKDVFTLNPGESIDLKTKMSVKPKGADPGKLTWKSSNTNVAVVDQNGICKVGGTGGTARITVTNEDGLSGYCDVECRAAVTKTTVTTTPASKDDNTASQEVTKAPEEEGNV